MNSTDMDHARCSRSLLSVGSVEDALVLHELKSLILRFLSDVICESWPPTCALGGSHYAQPHTIEK